MVIDFTDGFELHHDVGISEVRLAGKKWLLRNPDVTSGPLQWVSLEIAIITQFSDVTNNVKLLCPFGFVLDLESHSVLLVSSTMMSMMGLHSKEWVGSVLVGRSVLGYCEISSLFSVDVRHF